jgi:DivIVA domain-containing protein
MIDLTPLDVRKKRGDFRRILRGYDPEEVDTFMDLVAERFEELVRENLALADKNGRLEGQLEALEGRETAVQEALVSAQKLREEVKDQSQRDAEVLRGQVKREAELVKAETDSEIGRRLVEAEGLVRERQRALEELERSRLKFLKSFRSLLERELDAVDVEEARRPLEDLTLELEFRGWMPSGQVDEEDSAESEAPEVEAEAEIPDREPETPEVEPEGPEAEAETEVSDAEPETPEVEPEGPEAEAETEVSDAEPETPEADTEEEGEGGDPGLPGGFETQILEVAAPVGIEDLAPAKEVEDSPAQPEEGGAEEAQPGEDSPDIPEEPKWLFSLLKKEEEERGTEG